MKLWKMYLKVVCDLIQYCDKNIYDRKAVFLITVIALLQQCASVNCQRTHGESEKISLSTCEAQRYRKLEHLSYLTSIAFQDYFSVTNLSDSIIKDGNLTKPLFEDALAKLVPVLSGWNVDTKLSTKSCERLPVISSDVKIREFCEEVQLSECLSSEKLSSIIPESVDSFSEAFSYVCPFLLFQSRDQNCHTEAQKPAKSYSKPSSGAVWGFGFLFVTVVSCCSLVGIGILPFLNGSSYRRVLTLFEGLAVGSLASSALFHLIPQAFNLLGEDAQHDYLWKALIMFGGIYLFFLSERTMKVLIQRKEKKRWKRKQQTELGNNFPLNISTSESSASITTLQGDGENQQESEILEKSFKTQNGACYQSQVHHHHHHLHNDHHHLPQEEFRNGKPEIATVAWMIIFGDALHNFIDGLSMGAAFSESILSGVSISIAVICEELPHELGDFAVLLSAGMTMKKALLYNFFSACSCYFGFIFGVLLGNLAEGGPYIFALAGGMFLYISLVDMVGELSTALEEAKKEGTKEMMKIFVLQNFGILLGVTALFLMARYSEKINLQSLSK